MSSIIGDPATWLFQNPHPPFKKGDRVVASWGWGTKPQPGTVLDYYCTSPRLGDQYHVQLDGYGGPITFRLECLRPEPEPQVNQ